MASVQASIPNPSTEQDIQYHPPSHLNQQAFAKSEVDFQRLVKYL